MLALAIAYPITAHTAVVSRSGALIVASFGLLAALVLLPRVVRGSTAAWCALPLVVVGLLLLSQVHAAWLPLYAAPVLVNFFVAWIFGHTLREGHVPLIQRLARLLHAPEEPRAEIMHYARGVTVAWTVLLCGLGLLNLTLALVAAPEGILLLAGIRPPFTVSVETWSLFANFLNYAIAGGFFLAEYVYRQYRFPEQPYRNVLDFIRRAAAVGHQVLKPGQQP